MPSLARKVPLLLKAIKYEEALKQSGLALFSAKPYSRDTTLPLSSISQFSFPLQIMHGQVAQKIALHILCQDKNVTVNTDA